MIILMAFLVLALIFSMLASGEVPQFSTLPSRIVGGGGGIVRGDGKLFLNQLGWGGGELLT